jgi:hypothetical protein
MSDTVVIPSEVPAEGSVRITLDRVVTDEYPNYRKRASEDDIQELRQSLKSDGQLQNCVGTWITREGLGAVIAVVAGFSRIEAFRRLALQKVVDEYNKTFGKNSGDDGFIACGGQGFDSHKERELIKQAGPEWEEKYINALKNVEVRFETKKVKDKIHAAFLNMAENEKRSDATLGDKCGKIADLVNQGVKQSEIAKGLGITEPTVSHFVKINALPDHLIKVFNNLDAVKKGLNMNEGDAKAAQTRAIGACTELIRRLELRKNDPEAISFSHAREFSGEVLHKKDPLPLTAVYRILIDLTQVDDFGKPTKRSTVDWSVFKTKLADAKSAAKKLEDAPPPAPAANATVETLAKDQAAATPAATATPAAPAAEVSSGKETVTRATDADTKAAIQAENAKLEAAGDAAGVEVPEGEEIEDLPPDDSALEELEAETDLAASDPEAGPAKTATPPAKGDAPAKPEDGSTREKMKDAQPDSKYKPRTPDKLEAQAISYLKDCKEDHMVSQCSNMLAAVALLDAAGMAKESSQANEVYVNFSVPAEDYVTALEEALQKAAPKEFEKLQATKPTYVLPGFVS